MKAEAVGQEQGGTQAGVAPKPTETLASYRQEGHEEGLAAHTRLAPNAPFTAASCEKYQSLGFLHFKSSIVIKGL